MHQQIQRRMLAGKRTGREAKLRYFEQVMSTPHPPVKGVPARCPFKRW